jgi:hypothetical protein
MTGGLAMKVDAIMSKDVATAEDLPSASFAGQLDSFLAVRGPEAVLDSVPRCMASLFTDCAIVCKTDHGFDHQSVGLSVGVQAPSKACNRTTRHMRASASMSLSKSSSRYSCRRRPWRNRTRPRHRSRDS